MKQMCFFIRLAFFGVLGLLWQYPMAQGKTDYKNYKANIQRQLFHDYVDREQKNALRAGSSAGNMLQVSDDQEINYLVTQALTDNVDRLQFEIETDSLTTHTQKVSYLRGLENILKSFAAGVKSRKLQTSNFPAALEQYRAAMQKDRVKESVASIIEKSNYDVAYLLVNCKAFDNNIGHQAGRYAVMRKYANQRPDRIFHLLKDNPNVPFRDSLILVAAYKYPRLLYDFAAANNQLGNAIRKLDDSLVRTVSKMAVSGGSGQIYFAFLDNILKGRQTLEEINSVKDDDAKFYRMLVKTRMDYIERIRQKETVFELEALTKLLERRANDVFVRTINALHNEPDPVRFRILQQLTPQELYYLIVSGENEMYTSSYVRGVYPLMMQKIGNRGDSLMMSVGFDRFKKFIKMAAGFNTLNNFLKSFPDGEQAKSLMTAFVNGLEKTGNLEDGVDVADSYVSIYEGNKELASYMLELTKHNLDKNLESNNQRGKVIYNLLYKLFLSADSSKSVNLSQEFGIPPVYNIDYRSLANEKDQVIMQVFFYGDEDGMNAYQGFIRQFAGSSWKATYTNQWVAISSTKGKPVLIFANKPLPEETGEDEKAQKALNEYLAQQNLIPTVVIHRGHSYYAPYTIEQIQPTAKIVFLGSCGGYHLIHNVLKQAPDAHIIASKQIGKTIINQPFFNLLMEKMRNGSGVDWIPFWNEFRKNVTDKEGFEDYIPPHRNLGAIFIKAYNKAMGVVEDEE